MTIPEKYARIICTAFKAPDTFGIPIEQIVADNIQKAIEETCQAKDSEISRLKSELEQAREISRKIYESLATDTNVRIIQKMIELEKQNPNNLG